MIEAVTFDYWNTLVWEGSDQLIDRRIDAWTLLLDAAGIPTAPAALRAAHMAAFHEYQAAWRANAQYTTAEATARIVTELSLDPPVDLLVALEASFAVAGADTNLHLADGIAECLHGLHDADIRLGIICDVGLTPSPVLLDHLTRRDLLRLFDGWAFSDAIGVYKPDPAIYRAVLDSLEVPPENAAHVGDRLRTDVTGARSLGMRTIRYAGVYDDPDTARLAEADLVVRHYADFPAPDRLRSI